MAFLVSKTRLTELIKAFEAAGVLAGLDARPDLLGARDDKGRTWLHLIAAQAVGDDPGKASASVTLADGLVARGLDLNDAAFTEGPNGEWRATPLWCAISRGRNLTLASWLLEQGCDPDHAMFAAAWNRDVEAIRLLCGRGAPVRPEIFTEAVAWSRYEAAEELLRQGADPNAEDSKGRTALEIMLRKDAPAERVATVLRHGARTDVRSRSDGRTLASLLRGKRSEAFRRLAAEFCPPRAAED